jgi:hypothetical protein
MRGRLSSTPNCLVLGCPTSVFYTFPAGRLWAAPTPCSSQTSWASTHAMPHCPPGKSALSRSDALLLGLPGELSVHTCHAPLPSLCALHHRLVARVLMPNGQPSLSSSSCHTNWLLTALHVQQLQSKSCEELKSNVGKRNQNNISNIYSENNQQVYVYFFLLFYCQYFLTHISC